MKSILTLVLVLASVGTLAAECPAYLQGEYRKLHSSETVDLCDLLAGKAALIVNTASHCGFTPQFKALESVHQAYKDKGLVVLGVPSDDFKQAAETEEEEATICFTNYGVTFTMLAPSVVTGSEANALFAYLAEKTQEPGWNFNKYVLNGKSGEVTHFGSMTKPTSKSIAKALDAAL